MAAPKEYPDELKTELIYRRIGRTREETENALFAYIDNWCNTQHIQEKLGLRSPDEEVVPKLHRAR